MIQLRILGELSLDGPDGLDYRAVLAQPKRLALLVYLAVAGPGKFVRRDTLLALFWPDSDETLARGAFRQAVRFLRKSLGEDVIVNRGSEEVAISGEAVWCDAVAFRNALDADDPAAAMDLYRGDILEGFFIPAAPDFDRWLEAERSSLQTAATKAALSLADTAETTGDLDEAVRWTRRALDLSTCDEAIARQLILLLDQTGDRAGAVAAFETFVRTLERELDVEPSPETQALINAVRERTTGGVAPDLSGHRPVEPLRPPKSEATAPDQPKRRRLTYVLVGLAAFVLLAAAYAAFRPTTPASTQPILVIPFENRTGDNTLEPLGMMLAEWITQGISRTGSFEVVTTMTILAVESGEIPADAITRQRRLVRETGARSLIHGSYYRQNDSLFFHSEIVRARDNRVLAVVETVGVPEIAPMEGVELMRRRVLARLPVIGPFPSFTQATMVPPSYEAFRLFVAGMEAFVGVGRPVEALQLFQQAAGEDASYPMPLIASAIMYINLGDWAAADSIATRVEAFRHDLGPLEVATLDMVQALIRGDDAAAYEASVRQARIAPGTIGHYQVAEQSRRLNRPREALRVLGELQPDRGELNGWMAYWREQAYAHHMLGDHRRELTAVRRGRTLHPESPTLLSLEIRALAALGRIRDLERLIDEYRISSGFGTLSPGAMMQISASSLRAFDHVEAANTFNEQAIDWYREKLEEEPEALWVARGLAFGLFTADQLEESEAMYRSILEVAPTHIEILGALAVIAARRDDMEEAERLLDLLADATGPYLRYAAPYFRAAVAAWIDQPERAVALLRQAFSQGMQHGWGWHIDPYFTPLREYPAFQELLRPKG